MHSQGSESYFNVNSKDSDQTAETDRSLYWAHVSEDTFSHVVANIFL